MPSALVSVIVPLFNKENYIEFTLKSIADQTCENLELIIIDDGSTDSSLKVVRNFLQENKARFANVIIQSRPNTGQTRARKDGVDLATGEYIAFLDSDDVWHPDKLKKQSDLLMKSTNLDMVLCNYMMLYKSRWSTKAVRLSPIESKIRSWLLTSGFGGALESTALIRKSALSSINGFDPRIQMSGGLDLAFRFTINHKVGLVDDYLCGYRIIPDGWHNNKSDLRNSYDELLSKAEFYSRYQKQIRENLDLHLSLWKLRTHFSPRNLRVFASKIVSSPISSSLYLWATFSRNVIARLRGIIYLRSGKILSARAGL
jgi:glycosyltransferase involved in cell wall biosynthesis